MKYCSECGESIVDNSKFCGNCGKNFSSSTSGLLAKDSVYIHLFSDLEIIEKNKLNSGNKKESKFMNVISQFATLFFVVLGGAIGKELGLWVILAIVVPTFIGSWVAARYVKNHKTGNNGLKALFLLNLVTWFIPLIGFPVSTATFVIAERIKEDNIRRQWYWMSVIFFTVTLINSLYGAIRMLD